MNQNYFLIFVLLFVLILLIFTWINCAYRKKSNPFSTKEQDSNLYNNTETEETYMEEEPFYDTEMEETNESFINLDEQAPETKLKKSFEIRNNFSTNGGGAPIYLDRQNVDCGINSGINSVGMDTGWGVLTYNYNCTEGGVFDGNTQGKTTTTFNKSKTQYLDNLDVSCNENGIISQFKLQPSGENMYYQYTCNPMKEINCRSVLSDYTNSWPNNWDLKKLPMNCKNHEAIGKFQLKNNGDSTEYRYSCCSNDYPQRTKFSLGSEEVSSWKNKGNEQLLDLHNLQTNCGDNAINQFTLQSKDNKMRYKYTCLKGGNFTGPNIEKQTSEDASADQKNIIFLDRRSVDCGTGNVMTKFNLNYRKENRRGRRDKHHWKYVYNCRPIENLECRTAYTNWNEGNNRSISYLDRQNIKCADDEALQSFRLERNGDKVRYKFNCCKVKRELSNDQAKCYLNRYEDLQQAFGTDIEQAKNHWKTNGSAENRNPTCELSTQQTKCYKNRYNSELKNLSDDEVRKHWRDYGQWENRNPSC